MSPQRAASLTVLLATLLTGCGAATINELDSDLIDAYVLKVRMTETEGPFADSDAIYDRFTIISVRAEEAAGKLGEDDKLNKVALMRIAATAAWQANDRPVPAGDQSIEAETTDQSEQLESVLKFATAGKTLCDELGAAKAPERDCAYFQIVTALHNQSSNARQLQNYIGRRTTLSTEERLLLTGDVFEGAVTAYKKTTEHRETLRGRRVPQAYYRWLDKQRFSAFCDARNSASQYLQVYSDIPEDIPLAPDCTSRVGGLTNKHINPIKASLGQSFETLVCATLRESYGSWRFKDDVGSDFIVVPTMPTENICEP